MQSHGHGSVPFSKGKEPAMATRSTPSQPFVYFRKKSDRRPPLSRSTFAGPQTALRPSQSAGSFPPLEGRGHRADRSTATWTSSSADSNLLPDGEDIGDREDFVHEYNRLAKTYGIRLLVRGDFPDTAENASKSLPNRKGSWISRVLRQESSGTPQNTTINPDQRQLRHRRSISDATLNIVQHPRKDGLKDEDLAALVRLCGKSVLYLPTEYAPCSLVLPTCFRALAQALVQKADSPGIFRVPGSLRVVNALYDYYCTDKDTDAISSTTRCPTLPAHIKCGVHDIASTFKRFLAGLPGGILGSLSLFDALVAIHSQFHGDPELNRTKETKLRARLIALAIGTVRSRYQRELICSVFGLLCLAGRAAENAPREDEDGRPLPTADLMGYNALGIVFGPLLIGGLINSYSMKVADPSTGLVLLPVTPPRSRKDRRHHKKTKSQTELAVASLNVDKIHIANSITEMLVTNWRDVVRHMRNLGSLKVKRDAGNAEHQVDRGTVRSSASDSFSVGNPPDWNNPRPSTEGKDTAVPLRIASPAPNSNPKVEHSRSWGGFQDQSESLSVNQQPFRPSSSESSRNMLAGVSKRVLSPTVEESPASNRITDGSRQKSQVITPTPVHCVPSNRGPIYATQNSAPTSKVASVLQSNRTATNEDVATTGRGAKAFGGHHSTEKAEEWKGFQPSLRGREDSPPVEVKPDSQRDAEEPTLAKNREQESRKASPNTAYNSSRLIHWNDSVNGRTPLGYIRNNELNRSSTALQLVQSKGFDEIPRYSKHPFDEDHSRLSLYEKVPEPHEKASSEHILSNRHSFNSQLEDFPRYRESAPEADNRLLSSPPPLELTPKSTNDAETRRPLILHDRYPSKERLVPRKPPSPSIWYSNKLDQGYFDLSTQKESPLEKWKAFAEAGRASTESLAKSAKERRLRRNTVYGVPRQSRESLPIADKKQMTPELRPQLMDQRGDGKQKPLPLSPERKSIFEGLPPSPDSRASVSPVKSNTPSRINGSRPVSYRSASKPVDGAVKAMAALFDNTTKDSPAGPGSVLTGRTQSHLKGSKSGILPLPSKTGSPEKSTRLTKTPSVHTPTRAFDRTNYGNYSSEKSSPVREPEFMVNRGHLRHKYSRSAVEGTPTKFPCISLRPTGGFTATRKAPQTSPNKPVYQRDQELSRPPSLGTMVPHSEAPPVAQHMNFLRPSPSPDTSPQARNVSYECLTPYNGSPRQHPSESPRPTSGNSLLHAQICNLQKHLQAKTEEVVQLRRQLETRENLDIGTISEQLRKAKRECKMWRERAEAAEKRIAVFERFNSRIRGLKEPDLDGSPSSLEARDHAFGDLVDNSSSPCSVHTENQEVLEDRIRNSFKKSARIGGCDGLLGREDDEGVFGSPPSLSLSGDWRKSMPPVGGGGTRLWDAPDDLLDLDEDTSRWGALEDFGQRNLL